MKKRTFVTFLVSLIISWLLVVGLGQVHRFSSNTFAQSNQPLDLTVSAATSLQDALEAIKPMYKNNQPEVDITYNFGSSGSLQQQIEQGAPVDIFISAAAKQMDALEAKNLLLPETRRDLLRNKVVLIVSKDNTTIKSFEDLGTDALTSIALGESESVPAGKYAEEILTSLGILDAVTPKAVYGKDVRQVLNYVATGNVDAGIVYISDAKASEDVKIVATAPEDSHSPVIYPIAVLQDSANPEAAKELEDFLFTPEAQTMFQEYGFITVSS
ncbi:molybdate ABC transporter substrate-binding protein [Pleurocapsa sp. CCALA 161]|uniref:molybdate ABC transporter substrate-binding protein n=1 Tax=Pleurocapsa sp. CCALA 161 TaxID=2107688 RepID=UPI000D060447|nr:molybdate ABC transporter substrate-binding protein [Pleurocapsa sp. CCALA 161]PSB07905.1 molybdate ABC transporter substrate-binding protein [Pleurocapsa sp. CCALA 161]